MNTNLFIESMKSEDGYFLFLTYKMYKSRLFLEEKMTL